MCVGVWGGEGGHITFCEDLVDPSCLINFIYTDSISFDGK